MKQSITQAWRQQAVRLGERLCVFELGEGGRAWSWTQMESTVNRFRQELQNNGLKEGMRVVLGDVASNEWIAWMWACMEEGVVWCPLPPVKSVERRSEQMQHCDPHAYIENGSLSLRNMQAERCPPESAYLIYTSGSTGAPKGVLVGGGGLVPLWQAQQAMFGTTEQTKATWMLSPAFDASLSDIGVSLTAGACLYIVPSGHWLRWNQWHTDMQTHKIDQVDAPPAWLALWANKSPPPSLKTLIAGGEPTVPAILRAWANQVKWVNVYGPTEATICTSMEVRVILPDQPIEASIGMPLPHVKYRIDRSLNPTPGNEGELWIGGACLALEYWKDPERTRLQFVEMEGERWWKTGDVVEKTPQGEFIWKGRLDRQVKRNGKLIHLDEIETVLARLPGVSQVSVVIDQKDRITAILNAPIPSNDVIKAWCVAHLPAWGVPTRLVRLDVFPKNQNGKVDRNALLCAINTPYEDPSRLPY